MGTKRLMINEDKVRQYEQVLKKIAALPVISGAVADEAQHWAEEALAKFDIHLITTRTSIKLPKATKDQE